MSFELNSLFSLSILTGAVIGWVRFEKTDPAFQPFLWLVWLGLFNELAGIAIMRAGYTNAFNYNVFALSESILITLLYYKWGLFRKKKAAYITLQGLFVAGWVTENFVISGIFIFNSYFIIAHSLAIVLMSMAMMDQLLFKNNTPLLRQSSFLICQGLILLFTYTALVETFWIFGLNRSGLFRIRIYEIFAYINLFTNLIFALAILWMPMKRRYLLHS